MQIVVGEGARMQHAVGEGAQMLERAGIAAIEDRRFHPLGNDGVGFEDEMQSLAQVPAIHVHVVLDRRLDHVAAGKDAEIPVGRFGIDEAHVVIAVGRGEAPGPAARFHGEQDAALLAPLDRIEAALHLGPAFLGNGGVPFHGRVHLFMDGH
jgi:hypothetical protein